jgi:hypothetical protein
MLDPYQSLLAIMTSSRSIVLGLSEPPRLLSGSSVRPHTGLLDAAGVCMRYWSLIDRIEMTAVRQA